MDSPMIIPSEDDRAVSELLWFWAAIFDGPPSDEVWGQMHRVWTSLQDAGVKDALPALNTAELAREYEAWLLIPYGKNPTSPYDDSETQLADGTMDLWILAAALEVPWQKERYIPGRAYPIRPDHLSVLLALWAVLIPLPFEWEIAGQPVGKWKKTVGNAVCGILGRLSQQMPDGTGYQGLAHAALSYSRQVMDWDTETINRS